MAVRTPASQLRLRRWLHGVAALLGVVAMFAVLASEVPEQPTLCAKPEPGALLELPEPFLKQAPESVEDARAMQSHVKDLIARVSPAVVTVHVARASGSAVVISPDGLVLCAAHVCVRPGLDVRFLFPDGRTARGKTLGANHVIDSGLMQITEPGPWPHVSVAGMGDLRVGDWVLAMGHPGGFDPERSIVARLGRVIRLSSGAVQTDCTIVSGDSGGPLFDMHGRVVGIHSRISQSASANFHVPIGAYFETWDRLAKGDNWGDERPSRSWAFIGARGTDDPEGCRLEQVDAGSPAHKAGLRAGDIVRKVNDQAVTSYAAFRQWIARSRPGEKLKLTIKREDQEILATVTLESRRGRR